jgi:hypothetical protein
VRAVASRPWACAREDDLTDEVGLLLPPAGQGSRPRSASASATMPMTARLSSTTGSAAELRAAVTSPAYSADVSGPTAATCLVMTSLTCTTAPSRRTRGVTGCGFDARTGGRVQPGP